VPLITSSLDDLDEPARLMACLCLTVIFERLRYRVPHSMSREFTYDKSLTTNVDESRCIYMMIMTVLLWLCMLFRTNKYFAIMITTALLWLCMLLRTNKYFARTLCHYMRFWNNKIVPLAFVTSLQHHLFDGFWFVFNSGYLLLITDSSSLSLPFFSCAHPHPDFHN
jgi:hypothetical protein